MFTIQDGRDCFYQWDIDRKLIVEDTSVSEVHFCNRTDDCSLGCEVFEENGKRLVNVPNILLQTSWRIRVYAYDSKYTKHEELFDVKPRSKPADYIYTETEIKNYADLEERLTALEENAVPDELVRDAVEDYLTENPIEAVKPEELKASIDEALAEAKESGEFDGGYYTPQVQSAGNSQIVFNFIPSKDGLPKPTKTIITLPKGDDYVLTEEDKLEIVNSVIATLPMWEGGAY